MKFSKAGSFPFPASVIVPLHIDHNNVYPHKADISHTPHWNNAPASSLAKRWPPAGHHFPSYTTFPPHPCHHRLQWEFRFGVNVQFSCTWIVVASQKMVFLFCCSPSLRYCMIWMSCYFRFLKCPLMNTNTHGTDADIHVCRLGCNWCWYLWGWSYKHNLTIRCWKNSANVICRRDLNTEEIYSMLSPTLWLAVFLSVVLSVVSALFFSITPHTSSQHTHTDNSFLSNPHSWGTCSSCRNLRPHVDIHYLWE